MKMVSTTFMVIKSHDLSVLIFTVVSSFFSLELTYLFKRASVSVWVCVSLCPSTLPHCMYSLTKCLKKEHPGRGKQICLEGGWVVSGVYT